MRKVVKKIVNVHSSDTDTGSATGPYGIGNRAVSTTTFVHLKIEVLTISRDYFSHKPINNVNFAAKS
jgi:hypothetical protein